MLLIIDGYIMMGRFCGPKSRYEESTQKSGFYFMPDFPCYWDSAAVLCCSLIRLIMGWLASIGATLWVVKNIPQRVRVFGSEKLGWISHEAIEWL